MSTLHYAPDARQRTPVTLGGISPHYRTSEVYPLGHYDGKRAWLTKRDPTSGSLLSRLQQPLLKQQAMLPDRDIDYRAARDATGVAGNDGADDRGEHTAPSTIATISRAAGSWGA